MTASNIRTEADLARFIVDTRSEIFARYEQPLIHAKSVLDNAKAIYDAARAEYKRLEDSVGNKQQVEMCELLNAAAEAAARLLNAPVPTSPEAIPTSPTPHAATEPVAPAVTALSSPTAAPENNAVTAASVSTDTPVSPPVVAAPVPQDVQTAQLSSNLEQSPVVAGTASSDAPIGGDGGSVPSGTENGVAPAVEATGQPSSDDGPLKVGQRVLLASGQVAEIDGVSDGFDDATIRVRLAGGMNFELLDLSGLVEAPAGATYQWVQRSPEKVTPAGGPKLGDTVRTVEGVEGKVDGIASSGTYVKVTVPDGRQLNVRTDGLRRDGEVWVEAEFERKAKPNPPKEAIVGGAAAEPRVAAEVERLSGPQPGHLILMLSGATGEIVAVGTASITVNVERTDGGYDSRELSFSAFVVGQHVHPWVEKHLPPAVVTPTPAPLAHELSPATKEKKPCPRCGKLCSVLANGELRGHTLPDKRKCKPAADAPTEPGELTSKTSVDQLSSELF